jgi:hypothetical protein
MHPPPASADPMAMMLGALHQLIGRRQVVGGSARLRPWLREWPSREQLAQYEEGASFEVVGSKTGRRYRIHHGRLQDVYELDGEGHPIRGWCFMPEGGLALAMGDVMLAQKIALKADEERAITAAMPFWAAEARFHGLKRFAATWGRL